MAIAAHSCTGETCMICGHTKTSGIHICNQLICDSCQKEIVETDVNNWKYKYYIKKLAKLKIEVTEQTDEPD